MRHEDGTLAIGTELPGRGAWLCRDTDDCIDLAIRRKAFERALRGKVEDSQGEKVRAALRGTFGSVSGHG